ncbi:MAG: hypothetical protein GY867_09700 [bacterium]|nr:hypothetical protein [bacterium]
MPDISHMSLWLCELKLTYEGFMYTIEKKSWGYELIFGGDTSVEEASRWHEEWTEILKNQIGPFSVFVDMRTLIPLCKEAMEPLAEGQRLARQRGMIRSVVVVQNPATASQFRRIAGDTGINQWERYIDANALADWMQRGLDWILHGIEPSQAREAVRSH